MSVLAIAAGGVIMHIGLLDNDGGIDTRKLTLYTPIDFRMTMRKLHSGAPKIILRPGE